MLVFSCGNVLNSIYSYGNFQGFTRCMAYVGGSA